MKYCTIDDCERPVHSKNWCYKHYYRNWKHGSPNTVLKRGTGHGARTTHGLSKTPIYTIWTGMRNRCNNPNYPEYEHYGGRGITVCERWMTLENFIEDIGPRPSNRHSIDRIDNDGNYEPGNVRWATYHEQAVNKRNSSPHPGITKTINGTWRATFKIHGQKRFNKVYKTFVEAYAARKKQERMWLEK